MKGYGLVLGGGGAKGGYEIGVWRALRELNINIVAVAGASVGALNGALIIQDDYDAAYNLWTSLTVDSVMKVNTEVAAEVATNKPISMIETLMYAMQNGGIDTTPLMGIMSEILNEDKIRESKIDFGIVTFSISDFKAMRLYKEDIPIGQLGEYLLASACFPAFKPVEIGDKKFIDGGVYDNVPISLLSEKGFKNLIVVDISGPGFSQKVDTKGLNIINIKNSDNLGGTLDFNGERSKKNIEIGYLDTLKAFGKLKGSNYYIIHSKEENKKNKDIYIKSLNPEDFKKMYDFLGMDWNAKTTPNNRLIIDRILRTIQQNTEDNLSGSSVFPAMAEITAEQLEIDRLRTYTLDELVEAIINKYEAIKSTTGFNEYVNSIKNLIASRNQIEFDREMKKSIIEGKFIISYIASLGENDEREKRFRRLIAMAFPKISIANMFISLILSKRNQLQ